MRESRAPSAQDSTRWSPCIGDPGFGVAKLDKIENFIHWPCNWAPILPGQVNVRLLRSGRVGLGYG